VTRDIYIYNNNNNNNNNNVFEHIYKCASVGYRVSVKYSSVIF